MNRWLVSFVVMAGCNEGALTIGAADPVVDMDSSPTRDLSPSVDLRRTDFAPYLPPDKRPISYDAGVPQADVWFVERLAEPSPLGGRSIALADFNRDGRLDIATGGNVYLGRGDGTLEPPRPYVRYEEGEPQYPDIVVAGDFDGDGVVDLFTGCDNGNDVEVALGNGDGTFRSPGACVTGFDGQVFTADLNEDGKLDLVVGRTDPIIGMPNYGIGDLYILLGSGDGSFPRRTISSNVGVTAVADLNDDGHVDLVAGCVDPQGSAALWFGAGDGTFVEAGCGLPGSGLELPVDIDRDGYLDMVVAVSGYTFPPLLMNSLTVLHGSPGDPLVRETGLVLPSAPGKPVAADFDGDGNLDLVAAGDGELYLLLGRGDATFGDTISIPVGGHPSTIVSGDFDGDGRPDLVIDGVPQSPAFGQRDGFSIWLNRHLR